MHDLPSQARLQQAHAPRVTGEELEVLGKQAAASYGNGRAKNLTEAVVETVKKAGLSPEQVKRVVEFTNQNAYQAEFRKEGQQRYIDFEGGPASPADVLRDLNDGGGGTVFDNGSGDYRLPPNFTKKASAGLEKTAGAVSFSPEEDAFEAMFKVAEVPLPYVDPFNDAVALQEKLARAFSDLTGELELLEAEVAESRESLYGHVKEALFNGFSLGNVAQVCASVNPTAGLTKLAFSGIGPRLLQEGVLTVDELGESFTKVAHGLQVNKDHPIAKAFGGMADAVVKMAHVRAAAARVGDAHDRLSLFIKKGSAKLAANQALIPKAWSGLKGLAQAASEPVQSAVSGIAGDTAGAIAGGVVRKAPHVAAVLGAKEVYDRGVKHGPGRVPVSYVKSQIPGTQEYYQREYALQQKGWG